MRDRLARLFPYLLLAPAAIPLVYVGGIMYPYVTPKTFLLQGVGIAALSVFVYLALRGHSFFYARLRSAASWIPAALLLAAYLTSTLGIDFYRSFWGLFDRGDGLLTLTIITGFFYLILLTADRRFFERFVRTVAAVAGLVASIAVLQWVASVLGAEGWLLPPLTGRIGSTLGNAAFLAGYLGAGLFVILVALQGAAGASRRVFQASAVLSVLAILFAATRGTILALMGAGVAALGLMAVRGEGRAKRASRLALAGLLIFIGLFVAFRAELSQVPFEPLERIASISLSDGTVSSRLFVWQNVGLEALKRPWLGVGAEHVDVLFNRVYVPSKIVEEWFDRSHNAFLDYFAQYGTAGLALYLALIITFARYALRLSRGEPLGLANTGFLFLLLILTYALQNFFVFDTPASLWLLYALFALLIAGDSDAPPTPLRARLPASAAGLSSTLVALLVVPTVVLPLLANIFLAKGYLFHLVDVERANASFARGLSLNTYADLEYGYKAYSMYTENQATGLSGGERVAAYDYARSVLTKNLERYPYDARTATYLGHVFDTVPPEVTVDETFNRQVLDQAIALSPLRAQGWYLTANLYLKKADALPPDDPKKREYLLGAAKVLEAYARKETGLAAPRYILATLFHQLGDAAAAKAWADEGYSLHTRTDLAAARPAAKYYFALEDWPRAAEFLAEIVGEHSTDTALLYDLAKVKYLAGDRAGALEIVKQLRASDPALLETDRNFLTAITTYESR